jgi:hypothetical protein
MTADFDALARHVIEPDGDAERRRELERLAAADLTRSWIALSLRSAVRPPARPLEPRAVVRLQARLAGLPARASGRALLEALVADGERRSLGEPPSPARRREACGRLAAARAALARAWPQQARQTSWYLRKIVLVGPGGFEGTIPALPGLSFYRSGDSWYHEKVRPRDASPARPSWRDAEFLLHESAHQQLLLLGRAFPLWRSDGRRLVSPWSGVHRPALSFPAALHAYWITYEGLRRLGGADARLAELRRGFRLAFRQARSNLRLEPAGRRFLSLLERAVSRGARAASKN